MRRIKTTDVKEYGQIFRVNITSDNKIDRSFIVSEKFFPVVKRYIELRPEDDFLLDNFFLNYQNGRCTRQVNIK